MTKGIRYAAIVIVVLLVIRMLWPFYSVPTGSRGVVTQFGRIVGIENEGLAVLPPWQKLAIFSIRAEQANIDNAGGIYLGHSAGQCQPDGSLQHHDRQGVRSVRKVQSQRRPVFLRPDRHAGDLQGGHRTLHRS